MTYRRFEARLERLEREFSEADSLPGEGLAALLAYARRHPQAEAEDRDDEDDEDETPTGLGLLLREAQPWIAQGDQDAPGDQEPRQGRALPCATGDVSGTTTDIGERRGRVGSDDSKERHI